MPCRKSDSVFGSSGTHITLPDFYGSSKNGMIIPKTKDGRVVFMVPFQHHMIAGTTDKKCEVSQWTSVQRSGGLIISLGVGKQSRIAAFSLCAFAI